DLRSSSHLRPQRRPAGRMGALSGADPASRGACRGLTARLRTGPEHRDARAKAIALAQGDATPEQAQVVAAECVVLAETKDHLNWELIGEVVKRLTGEPAKVLRAAYKEVEDQEDE